MNTLLLGFIGPQEIIIILILLVPGFLGVLLLVFLIRYLIRKSKAPKNAVQPETQINNQQEPLITAEKIKEYYPVKEGNKITLIRFDEVVDLSAGNNFVFLTDITGKEYVVDNTLAELEQKFPEEFIRIHKSTVVNKNLIHEVKKLENGRFDLVMKCEKERILSCSKSYNEKIRDLIDF
ncbi:LytTR family transcriptional regulator DNA-binding domain-containing protein [Draconibacterium orientale]|uniref:LytR/AlgR family response regulator transcription factor n=1 Tax=Draconibacterium orientale TaxID=1168034 RepID=UPI0029C0779E|nr:LytTR family transcriptional regulator DNA-binding domain-containing protein [Draconibacterium orientale]